MNLTRDKNELINLSNKLLTKDYVRNNSRIYQLLREFVASMKNDFYTILVLGEFKRGKSTFINALLGQSLLPMNVLPETATINAIMYNDEPKLNVVFNDGREVTGEVTYEYLNQFSARQENSQVNEIKYIKIGYPLELLHNRIVLVDTPGVSDINEQRCEVTYQFIPKANAVIFLLDANSPLKKTERDFIEEKILSNGIKNILFILNKYDDVDEDEEEDLLDDVKERLLSAFNTKVQKYKIEDIKLYPLSARQALQGIEQENDMLHEASGLETVKKALENMIFNGDIERDKIEKYKSQLREILDMLERDLINGRNIKLVNVNDINSVMEKINELLQEKESNKKNIIGYINQSKDIIYAMTNKSIQFFHKKLQEDIEDNVNSYNGVDFKSYIEINVTKRIRNNMESWVAMYSPHIDVLLKNLENELARGISYYFKQKIRLSANTGIEMKSKKFILNIEANDVSSVNLQAGAIAAVGSIGILALVGGTIMPLISFAALPFLRDYMLKQKLATAKEAVLPELKIQITKAIMELQKEVNKYIDMRCQMITSNTEYGYEKVLMDIKQRLIKQLDERKIAEEKIQSEIDNIADELNDIKELKRSLI